MVNQVIPEVKMLQHEFLLPRCDELSRHLDHQESLPGHRYEQLESNY